MRAIILTHAARYPRMEAQDLVKLLYQSVFGGGHMVSDPQGSLRRLTKEYRHTVRDIRRPLTEEIGGGLLRVDLHAFDAEKIPLAVLNDVFIRSAAAVSGTAADFTQKLDLLLIMGAAGELPADECTLRSYLAEYSAAGFPAVSHSASYKTAYDPSYRVVCRDLFDQLL